MSLYINPWLFALIVVVVIVVVVFVVIWVVRAHQRKTATGKEELLGKAAVAETALNPKGMVLVDGEHWTAVVDNGRVEPEEEVIITRVDGLKLMVTRKN
ncbi:MAG: NfeD family protein [Dehalococcoidales bacterium]|jgi:membrane-bound serine protease (ClpP class)